MSRLPDNARYAIYRAVMWNDRQHRVLCFPCLESAKNTTSLKFGRHMKVELSALA